MSKISDKLERVKEDIASACARVHRDPQDIRLIVVTKTEPLESIKEIVKLGYTELGENRVVQLKQTDEDIMTFLAEHKDNPSIPDKINWHMIGHLQRNKVKKVLKLLKLIHSVDTLRLAEEINSASKKFNIKAEILMQVNCSGEPQKYGAPVGAATHLAEQITTMPNVRLKGLMTMAPLTKNKDVVRSCFIRAREIFEEIKGEGLVGRDFAQLSMGMSQDYEIAVEEGATLLRIGSAIFT